MTSPTAKPTPITNDGDPDVIYNGIPDWVYEEEVFASDHALWWAPDLRRICYVKFDDSKVPLYTFPFYGSGDPYNRQQSIRYPKPGATNPQVTVLVHDLETKKKIQLPPPKKFADGDFYVTAVVWRDASHVAVTWLNRAQNHSIISICNVIEGGVCYGSAEVVAHGVQRGWVEATRPPLFVPSGDAYFLLLPVEDGIRGAFKQIVLVNSSTLDKPGAQHILTHEPWDVMELAAYDQVNGILYFIGTGGNPLKRHLYRIFVASSRASLVTPECVTCNMKKNCEYYSVNFSPAAKHYILTCHGPALPSVTLHRADIDLDANDTALLLLEDNSDLQGLLNGTAMSTTEWISIPLGDEDDTHLWAQVILPPVLNKKEIVRYPTLFQVYNGPGSQKVTYEWKLDWDHYLASYHDVIVVTVDGRGTGGRGDAFLHAIYRKLGTLEVDDQMAAARYFQDNVHYVDPLKMAIMGWSYGGFVAASVLGRNVEHDLFQCGVAVAPVTDWTYYDSIYTERYMGNPSKEDNFYNYRNANVSSLASNFQKVKFLLIHGTADDNVHYQHSAMLTKSMIEEGIQFRSQVYPDKHHGLVGDPTRKHLYKLITGFLKDCFGGFDHHRRLHLVLDSLEEIADIELNGGMREDEEEEEAFRSTTSVPTDTPIGF